MKIERIKKAGFDPVNIMIKIETEHELDIIREFSNLNVSIPDCYNLNCIEGLKDETEVVRKFLDLLAAQL